MTAVVSGGAARALSSLLTLVSLPLAVRYLGAERYGVWATVVSVAVWVNLLDLGIANSLTNLISQAYARQDRTEAATSLQQCAGSDDRSCRSWQPAFLACCGAA